jgi:hypothetical protein
MSMLKFFFNIEIEIPLNGYLEAAPRPVLPIKDIFNGTFQNNFEKYFSYNMAGRKSMVIIYNQILYSFFGSINSDAIMMGKNKYLFDLTYDVRAYLDEPDDDKKKEFFDKLVQLTLLQKKIEELGKLLFVIITPSKASIYKEYFPEDLAPYVYMKNRGEYALNYYEYFVSMVGETGLKYFDFHDELLELKNKGTDIYTNGGAHWTGPAAAVYFSELINVMNRNTEKKIGTIQTVNAVPVWGDAFMTDDDIERILNKFPKYTSLPERIQKILPFYKHIFPISQFYSYHMESLSVPTDYKPSVFVCGGSFNWAWLYMVYGLEGWVTKGDNIFSSTEFSFYNAYVMKYPENIRIADTTDNFYSVMDKDIIIFELNEQAMDPDARQFAFAENLLDFIEKILGI